MQPSMDEQPPVISQDRATQIVKEVQSLIRQGEAQRAWDMVRHLHPADIGAVVAALPKGSRDALLTAMSPETVTWILRQMNPLDAARLSARIGSRALSFVLNQVRPQEAMEALQRLPTPQAQAVAETLEQPLPAPELLEHQPNTAGALMVAQFPTVNIGDRAESALDSLRALERVRYQFTHVFVLRDDGALAGQVNMVDLALAQDDTPVRSIAAPIEASVTVATSAEECARLRRHYNLTQLPVVDEGRLIGVIPSEFLLSAAVAEDTRQMLQVASVAGEAADGPVLNSIRTRLPWLTVNLGTTFLAAAMIAIFESTLAELVVLAAFLPVVAGQGGIGGTQTLTLIVRAMALGQLVGINAWRLLTREALLGLLHGVWLGVLVAVIAIVWQKNLGLALVLGVAMLGNMIIAGTVGAGVPLFLRRVGVDPAVASAIVVTTFTDVFGFLLYLGIASAMISLII